MKQLLLYTVLIAALFSCNTTKKGFTLVWKDEFKIAGLPDSSKWSYDVGGHGWGNNELQYYTKADPANAIVKDGKLHITARKQRIQNNAYTSAKLITKYKGDWLYGRIEVKAKLPAGKGVWPAIWMLPTDWEYGDWPGSGEIDIMENVGYMPDSVFSSIHTKSFNHLNNTQTTGGLYFNDLGTTFHVYATEWYKDHIDFFVDDKKFLTFKNTNKGFAEWPFDKRFYLILNIAMGGNWGGKFGVDERITSATMQVEYVRVYSKR
jgi:beta-glucanase (GH16 family)